MTQFSKDAAASIQKRFPNFKPKLGIILGSGLGAFASHLSNTQCIDYSELPGFPTLSVHGHSGKLVLGELNGVALVCLQGRAHNYEGDMSEKVKTYVRTLKLLGCEYFIATNAAGSLNIDVKPGSLMLIHDHINLQPTNPLVGPNDEEFGPRFLPVDNAYNEDVRKLLQQAAQQESIPLHSGIYLSVLGPCYETAAEIRAFKLLGADAVGMSTVPEVLVAHHCGLKIGVISILTNYATGLATTSHNHNAVVDVADNAASLLTRLIKTFVTSLPC